MANGGLGSIWTRLLQEVDYRIAKALANIGVVGTTIQATNIAGQFNTTISGVVTQTTNAIITDADLYVMVDDDGSVMIES